MLVKSTRDQLRVLQEKAIAIYDNDYVAKVRSHIQMVLSPENYEKYEKYVNPERNILKRIAGLSAVMYQRAPWRRDAEGRTDAVAAINEFCTQLNRKLYQAETMVYAVADLFIMPYWDEYRERVDYELITPDKVEVNVQRSTVVWIQIVREYQGVKRYTRYWSNGFTDESTDETKWYAVPSIFEGHKVCPIIWLSLRAPTEDYPFAIGEIRDLINATIGAATQETYRNRGHFLRSQRIPNLKNPEAMLEAGKAAGEDNSLPTDQDTVLVGDYDALSLADENDKFLDSIRADIADAASSRGISSQNYNKSIQSKDQLEAVSEELRLRWRQNRTLFVEAEKDLLKASLILINYYKNRQIDVDTKWIIEYLEPLPSIDDPKIALDVLADAVQLGVDNAMAFVMRTNPDINTEDEAMAYIKNNVDIRAVMVELMRELNEPADPRTGGQSAERNGANGPLAVSAPLDPNSKQNNQGV